MKVLEKNLFTELELKNRDPDEVPWGLDSVYRG